MRDTRISASPGTSKEVSKAKPAAAEWGTPGLRHWRGLRFAVGRGVELVGMVPGPVDGKSWRMTKVMDRRQPDGSRPGPSHREKQRG